MVKNKKIAGEKCLNPYSNGTMYLIRTGGIA